MKRILSLILCVLMLLTLLPFHAAADDEKGNGFWENCFDFFGLESLCSRFGMEPAELIPERVDRNALFRSFLVMTGACEHDYDNPSFDWDSEEDLVFLTLTCSVCGDIVILSAAPTVEQVPATETEPAKIIKTVTIEYMGKTYTDQIVIIVEPAHDHVYGEPEWGEDTSENLIAIFTCGLCSHQETVLATIKSKTNYSATCTTPKMTVYQLTAKFQKITYSGEYVKERAPALGHNYQKQVTEASCTQGGVTTYTCSRCNDSYTEDETPALGHDYGEWTQTKAPTCTESGEECSVCSRCGDTRTQGIEALGHDYSDWTQTKAPTCTETGEDTSVCSRCGDTRIQEIEALGHDYSDWTQTKAPTCTETGKDTSVCSRCGDTRTQEIEALGHDYGDWTQTKAPTCTETGEDTSVCSRCGDTRTQEIEALGHDYGDWTQEKAATCTETGEETSVCSRCGETLTREIASLGHDYGEWTQAKAPTCTEKGEETSVCSRCGETQSRLIAALSHAYTAEVTMATCTEKGYTTHVCARCGDRYVDGYTKALGHKWDGGKVTKQPTVSAEGEKTYTCTRCGEQKKESIPKLQAANFVDIKDPNAYYYDAVYWAVAHKPYQITAGLDKTHFGPDKTVTRAQAMVFFWAAKDRPKFKKANTQFVDVRKTDWYYKAIMWAVENGITAGTDATHFSPNKTCNRGEILTFLYAAMNKPKVKIKNPYKDVTNQWYKKAALWAYEQRIEKGENGKFNAATPCTRASTVTYLYRFLERKSLLD